MKHIEKNILLLFAALLLLMLGCTSRVEEPVIENEFLKVYSAKDTADISIDLTTCRRVDKKSGDLTGEGDQFVATDQEWIRAVASIGNRNLSNSNELMFHFDWTGPSGYTFYTKQIDLLLEDSSSVLVSSISLAPDTRQAGIYTIRLYYFRELLAEKKFEVLPEFDVSGYDLQAFTENLKLSRKGKKASADNAVFRQQKKGSVKAEFVLDNTFDFKMNEVLYRFDWYIKGDTIPFYRKRIDVDITDSPETISSTLSIDPEKRKVGDYFVVVNIYGKSISEKAFSLLPPLDYSNVNTNVVLYKKKSKKSGKLLGQGTTFKLGKKNKVRAQIKVSNLEEFKGEELDVKLRWVGPDGKGFYSKSYSITPEKSTALINASISIKKGKREPGKYSLKVYLFNELVSEQSFNVTSD